MRFVARASGGKAHARAGLLYGGGGGEVPIETPALLLSTRKGLPFFIPPDLLASLPSPDSRLLQVSPLHFVECPSLKTVASIGGLHKMLGLHESFFVASPRDAIVCLPASEATNKLGASFETQSGRRLIKSASYMEMISSLKPNLWTSLADEVPAWVSEQRNCASVNRTLRWLDECIALDPAAGEGLLAAIVGGSSVQEREKCSKEVAMRDASVAGYWIGGFGLGESMEERPPLLLAVIDNLPEEKLRKISGLGLPEEILECVSVGIDLFDSTYIYHLTIEGFAMVFFFEGDLWNVADAQLCDIGSDGTKINLRATVYRKDTRPILENCSCYTCRNHTRAYLNHLLNVHEMLAQTLLEIHNTHHYLGFFRAIRDSIKQGEFDLFYRKFLDNRRELVNCVVPCS